MKVAIVGAALFWLFNLQIGVAAGPNDEQLLNDARMARANAVDVCRRVVKKIDRDSAQPMTALQAKAIAVMGELKDQMAVDKLVTLADMIPPSVNGEYGAGSRPGVEAHPIAIALARMDMAALDAIADNLRRRTSMPSDQSARIFAYVFVELLENRAAQFVRVARVESPETNWPYYDKVIGEIERRQKPSN